MIRALIVDDEPLAREELSERLATTRRVAVVASCGNALDALKALRRESPDALFLDVQMPGVDGFEFLGMLDDGLDPAVVMLTVQDEHAVRAFDESAVAYLVKPIDRELLAKVVERLENSVAGGPRGTPARALARRVIRKIPCRAGRIDELVPAAEVEFVRFEEAGVYVATAAGDYLTELSLGVLEARSGLVRCHPRYLVNPARIDEISPPGDSLAVITTRSGRTVPLSLGHLAEVRTALDR